jgi:phage anti-repressor protein
MIKKFNKRQLLDQCGFNAEETQIILDYQKKLPILIDDGNNGDFSINAKDLWEQLDKPQGRISAWISRKLVSKKTKGGELLFHENSDYSTIAQKCAIANTGGFKEHFEYYLTLDCAKNVAMMENTDSGMLCRKYFILMEKAVKANIEWELIRHPLREGYKAMQKALDEYMLRMVQRNADEWDYRIEADALNVIATGFKAQDIRNYVGCQDNKTRDSLTATYNEYLLKLQELNIVYLGMNMNRYDRYKMLKQSFDILFPNAVPIKDDVDISRINENKAKLLEEVKLKAKVA